MSARAFKQYGFTLVELLVVILIIGILVAVAAPSYLGQSNKANDSRVRQNLAVAYRDGKTVWIAGAEGGIGYPDNVAGADGLIAQLQANEPQLTFAQTVNANNPNQISVQRVNADAVVYGAKSRSGRTYCLEAIETATGAADDGVSPGLYWSGGTGTDPCGAGAVWGTPNYDPALAPSNGSNPLPDPQPQADDADPTNQANVCDNGTGAAAPASEILYTKESQSGANGDDKQIWEAGDDGSNPQLLVGDTGGPVLDPTWSTDRKSVIYSLDDGSGSGGNLWAQAATPGGAQTQVTNSAADIGQPVCSPNGAELAYVKNTTSSSGATLQSSIMLQSGQSAAQAIVTAPAGHVYANPVFSPDSSQIAYMDTNDNDNDVSHLRVVSIANPSGDHALTSNDNYTDQFPVWSGTNLLYIQQDNTQYVDYLAQVPAAGGAVTQLGQFGGLGITGLSISPDGTQLLYSGSDSTINNGTNSELLTGETVGGNPAAVITDTTGNVTFEQPAW